MDPVSLYPVLPIIFIALGTMKMTGKLFHIAPLRVKYASIDGLRGFLAFFVFLHHSVIWYFFLRTGYWAPPPSNLYSHFGATSVSLFFMITSFLFFSKLIEAKSGNIDWLKLFVSRVLRIVPLYLVALCLLFLTAAIVSHFLLHEPALTVLFEAFQWMAFIEVDINGIQPTKLIIAGVVWSLAFEWMFYFSLPFLGLFLFKIKASTTTMAAATILLLFFIGVIFEFYPFGALQRMSPFLGGCTAAILAKNERICQLASGKIASGVMVLFLFLVIFFFSSVYSLISFLLMVAIFIGIACGNSLFGILTHPLSRTIGQISYSIYLLHGIILFVTFRLVIGFANTAQLSPLQHWGVISACSIVVVLICSITYKYIELPSMNAASRMSARLRAYLKEH